MNKDEIDIIEDENYPEYIEAVYEFKITKNQKPERIDHFLKRSILNATRTRVQKAIDNGTVTVNGEKVKPSRKTKYEDVVVCKFKKPPPIELRPEPMDLDIVFEDDYLIVVNKPANVCTHPGLGNRYGTLLNGILYHFGVRRTIEIEYDEDEESEGRVYASDEIRPGIVHRIDKDTSGLIVIAKNAVAHTHLAEQFAAKTTQREYRALVWGKFDEDSGSIEGNIGRSLNDRKKFAVHKNSGKKAKTDWKVEERFDFLTLLKLRLHTGRTHQIRVHCAHIGHPVFGDETYDGAKLRYSGHNPVFRGVGNKALSMVNRQMLHAKTLGFVHPITKEKMLFDSEIASDMQNVINFVSKNSIIDYDTESSQNK